MDIRRVKLSDLIINRANDRHGELQTEVAAISWLFHEREQHTRNLAKDILASRQIYELPLVLPEGDKYVVFDGNRRVTCMKMLADPKRAPTHVLREFFGEQRAAWSGAFPDSVVCQVESDRDRIDEILFRRHTGTQSGVGQSTWDDRMKRNFVDRTGRSGAVTLADEIEKLLERKGLLPTRRKIPRSTLNRLLSAEPLRNKVGISFKNNKLVILGDDNVTINALARIADDLAEREIVLGNIWDTVGKEGYLNRLADEGVLPSEIPAQTHFPGFSEEQPIRLATPKKVVPQNRTTAIPQKEYGVQWKGSQQRIQDIWQELQFRLLLAEHPNAISVLLRVLLELSIDHYSTVRNVPMQQNDKLSLRFEKAAADLFNRDLISRKDLDRVRKFQNQHSMVSTDTLNRFVHSYSLAPSSDQLTSIWDSLSDMVVLFLNAEPEK